MRVVVDDLSICGLCLDYAANGKVEDDGHTITITHRHRMCKTLGNELAFLVPVGSGEGGLSRTSCDGCGDPVGGLRFPAAVLGHDRQPPVYVSEFGPTVAGLCDHDRKTCARCLTVCRVCEGSFSTRDALAAHVAADHVIGRHDCNHCGRHGGH